jgi:hypothetical protein
MQNSIVFLYNFTYNSWSDSLLALSNCSGNEIRWVSDSVTDLLFPYPFAEKLVTPIVAPRSE